MSPPATWTTTSPSGINNATLTAAADAIDDFIAADPGATAVNDQVLFITRGEIQDRLLRRADLQAKLRDLTFATARCIADYGKRNPGAPNDRRLPWPAPVDLAEYRTTAQYNDTPVGELSGRVANVGQRFQRPDGQYLHRSPDCLQLRNGPRVDAGNGDPVAALEGSPVLRRWPGTSGPTPPLPRPAPRACGVNGTGAWAAVVHFSGTRLAALSQMRDEPPMNADTRSNIANYLEGRNASNHPNAAGAGDYQSGTASTTFNDILYCIDANLSVTPC